MGLKLPKLKVYKMRKPNLKDFMKKNELTEKTMNEYRLRKLYKNPRFPRDSKTYSVKRFVIIDDGSMGGSH